MGRMFGDRINEFVLSVDIMNEDTFKQLVALVSSYLKEQLGVVYFSVLEEGEVDGSKGLTTLWSSADARPSFSVSGEGEYGSFSAYSFGENRSLWVVSESREPLGNADDYEDHWSESKGLPSYKPSIDTPVRTSVMRPLRRGDRPIGVMEFASESYIKPTPASLEEVKTLAATISRAYRMYDVRESQKDNTARALRLLEASLTEETWTRLALPQIFVAYPGGGDLEGETLEAHKTVIKTIRQVVEEFSDVLSAEFWEDISESGNITSQVINKITFSEFGLCYFSEPEDGRYADNANVLFEAGMMQALTNSPGALLRAWVPLRERNSPDMPFDVAGERMVLVDRKEDGSLDTKPFTKALRKTMKALLAELKAPDD